jgi:Fur family transcriptional regulator, ferric uptake regulator
VPRKARPGSVNEELRAKVRENGLRATPSRIAVLRLLRASAQPLSHGEVADRLGSELSDRATIYRNLIDLVEAGLVRRSDLGDHVWRFEAVAAGHGAEIHPHFVCTSCGAIECLPDVELALRKSRTPRALRARQVEVQVRGVCDACS